MSVLFQVGVLPKTIRESIVVSLLDATFTFIVYVLVVPSWAVTVNVKVSGLVLIFFVPSSLASILALVSFGVAFNSKLVVPNGRFIS